MSDVAQFRCPRAFAALLGACAVVALCGAAAPAGSAPTKSKVATPDFIANYTIWRQAGGKDYEIAPAGYPDNGGIGDHPDYRHLGNSSGTPNLRIGNDGAEILLPWAKDQMKKTREAIVAGAVPYDPAQRCWPAGVPVVATFAVEPMQFIPVGNKEVLIVYQRGQVVRHIYMNQPHSKNLKPTWYGELVGHYEDDGTFVIDTIGQNDKTFVDDFNTPHTDKLHVVERYKLIDDGKGGKTLQEIMILDDPGTFTRPWAAMKTFRLATAGRGANAQPAQIDELLCEINNDDVYHQGLRPVPTATKPDF